MFNIMIQVQQSAKVNKKLGNLQNWCKKEQYVSTQYMTLAYISTYIVYTSAFIMLWKKKKKVCLWYRLFPVLLEFPGYLALLRSFTDLSVWPEPLAMLTCYLLSLQGNR